MENLLSQIDTIIQDQLNPTTNELYDEEEEEIFISDEGEEFYYDSENDLFKDNGGNYYDYEENDETIFLYDPDEIQHDDHQQHRFEQILIEHDFNTEELEKEEEYQQTRKYRWVLDDEEDEKREL